MLIFYCCMLHLPHVGVCRHGDNPFGDTLWVTQIFPWFLTKFTIKQSPYISVGTIKIHKPKKENENKRMGKKVYHP